MTLTLHLVRHGRTVYNTEHLLQGWCDSPLTSEGLDGVRATAEALAGVPFVAAYASPLGRTVATAQEILTHHDGLDLTLLDGLKEFSFGDHEKAPEEEFWSEHSPDAVFGAVFDGTFPGFPGGESGAAFMERTRQAFARITADNPDGDVLVVSHGVTLLTHLARVSMAAGQGPLTTPLPNASVSEITVSGGRARVRRVASDPAGHGIPGGVRPGFAFPPQAA
ncbi:histidine phosphatase family protein [Demequina lignilytica]|uniref:Histidine phosphatase family protein n=1 Tax=Demequina lignilytica TaxID=3051663 RepID=A0AB35ME98_9MICO|nr:histidine phosphatase family protein [Demequina sp. SYSU T0a273]MDN4482097.1 histidine phosphatase family protein [Demequina sp. SYSU T0a273]